MTYFGKPSKVSTPWGRADWCKPVTRGINCYATPGHGGYCVSAGKAKAIHPALRSVGIETARGVWFEEDCAWAVVPLSFPGYFDEEKIKAAHSSAKSWFPDEYTAAGFGPVAVEDSFVLRERAFLAATRDAFVVKSAAGSWHHDCPDGFVLTYATRRSDGYAKNFLIPADEYKGRGPFGFVVEDGAYEEILPTPRPS